MDDESLRYVAEDLAFLRAWNDDISDPEIRRGSATLRRLLIDGGYGAAWRASGFQKEPRLIAVDLKNLVSMVDIPTKVEFIIALGVTFKGYDFTASMSVFGNEVLTPMDRAVIRNGGHLGEREFGLTEYLRSFSAYGFGEWITRAEVIKYIAYAKSGVHPSPSQKRREAHMIERISKIEKRFHVNGTDGLFLELVAIAQAIARSDDANRLIAAIEG